MPTLAEYQVSLIIEAEDIQAVIARVHNFADKHGDGSPDGIIEISIQESK